MAGSSLNADFSNYPSFISFASAPRTQSYAYIQSDVDLSGKSALITGASQGIGRLTALALARAGCSNIAISSRSEEALHGVAEEAKEAAKAYSRSTPQLLVLRVDITSETDVATAAKTVTEAFGGTLDILVNNAGFLETYNYVQDSDTNDWWHTWEVNVKGHYLTTRSFLPLLLKSSLKTVVNLTSGMGILLVPGNSAYNTAKMALCRFTENLVGEYGGKGLLAFAFEPGLTDTDMATKMHPELYALPKDDPSLAPDTIVWLVKESRQWLSGRLVSARWDMEEVSKKKDEIVAKDLMKFRVALG